ncbi:MAG: hypothetical protein HPY52_15145 [Firmicutes bacterium]|nr:hypothetical protein [Bacillota bacterium]
MFRALLCAKHIGIQGITKLVSLLKSSDILATAAGFHPDDIPGVGTFYDFMYRLWGEDKKRLAIGSAGTPTETRSSSATTSIPSLQ